jgi:hypothetical protein
VCTFAGQSLRFTLSFWCTVVPEEPHQALHGQMNSNAPLIDL